MSGVQQVRSCHSLVAILSRAELDIFPESKRQTDLEWLVSCRQRLSIQSIVVLIVGIITTISGYSS